MQNVLETPELRALYQRAKCLFFDCDGVIFDSNGFKIEAMRQTIAEYSPAEVDQMEAFWRANGGASRFVKFEHFFTQIAPRAGHSIAGHSIAGQSDVAALVKTASERFGQLSRKAYDGASPIPAALALARAKGAERCHVVSGATEEEIVSVFESKQISSFFATLQGSPRPKRALVEKVLAAQACAPSEALLIGDGAMDFRVSQELGIHFIYLAEFTEWTGARAAIATGKAVSVAESWAELTRALLG
jgi:phosphoglycolate phosphatase-like HAD superfamily hydrolase